MTASSPASPPPTNGTKASALVSTYVVPMKSMLEEEPLLDLRRILDKKEPELRQREISNLHDYNSVKEEYSNKYQIYMQLDKKLLENKELFKSLTEQYSKCNDGTEKTRIADTLRQLFTVRQEEVKKLTNAFKIMHDELAQLKKLVASFVNSKRQ
jgi:nitrogen fixation/metabolism regulation signal transduction histidine kinase